MNKLLEKAKPILFNTDMVQAILDGRKTETRRPIKPQPKHVQALTDGRFETSEDGGFDQDVKYIKPRYQIGDILWVRETWCRHTDMSDNAFEWPLVPGIYYKADAHKSWVNDKEIVKWRPAIHMPREAARIFLRVTDVRVERLQNINHNGIKNEGCLPTNICGGELKVLLSDYWVPIWDSVYKSRGHGWDTNPWVWVIKFKRMEGLKDV